MRCCCNFRKTFPYNAAVLKAFTHYLRLRLQGGLLGPCWTSRAYRTCNLCSAKRMAQRAWSIAWSRSASPGTTMPGQPQYGIPAPTGKRRLYRFRTRATKDARHAEHSRYLCKTKPYRYECILGGPERICAVNYIQIRRLHHLLAKQ